VNSDGYAAAFGITLIIYPLQKKRGVRRGIHQWPSPLTITSTLSELITLRMEFL
jgi:hypothetical protein